MDKELDKSHDEVVYPELSPYEYFSALGHLSKMLYTHHEYKFRLLNPDKVGIYF